MSESNVNENENERRSGGKHGGLNGLRIPLLVDGAMFLTLVIMGTKLFGDVQQLKDERQQRVSGERIAIIEGKIDALTREVRRSDEEAQRDRARIWQILDREHGSERR